MPSVQEQFARFADYFDAARDVLVAGRRLRGRRGRRARGAIGHAIAFPTWRSLVREQGLSDAEAVALMAAAVRDAAGATG